MKPKPSVVVFVANVERMTRFYRELASMDVIVEEPGYAVLSVDGLELVIHALRGEPTPGEGLSAAPPREDTYLKLCLPVASIAEARATAAELGGSIKSVEHEWVGRAFRACDGADPEGNVIQVREPAAD